jgi:hypothetical protein
MALFWIVGIITRILTCTYLEAEQRKHTKSNSSQVFENKEWEGVVSLDNTSVYTTEVNTTRPVTLTLKPSFAAICLQIDH